MIQPINCENPIGLPSRSYVCGHCGNDVASEKGWSGHAPRHTNVRAYIYICHRCTGTTFFSIEGAQFPGAAFGEDIADVTDKSVQAMYDEARGAFTANSFTAAVLCCRKLLMHIAVAKGAAAGSNFVTYVE